MDVADVSAEEVDDSEAVDAKGACKDEETCLQRCHQ